MLRRPPTDLNCVVAFVLLPVSDRRCYRCDMELRDFRIGDLQIFSIVQQCGSVSGASRQIGVSPSQVSKAIARLEAHMEEPLLLRSSRGVTLTKLGKKILPGIHRILVEFQHLRPTPDEEHTLAIAAPTYLNDILIPRLCAFDPKLRVRALEMSPALIRTYAGENILDAALLVGETQLTDSWSQTEVGVLHKSLFASPGLATQLGTDISAEDIRDVPLITPVSSIDGRFVLLNDDCPLGDNRRVGHEAYTIALGLQMASVSNHLVFGPRIAVRSYIARGDLVEISVAGWDEKDAVFFACHVDRVKKHEERFIVDSMRHALERA